MNVRHTSPMMRTRAATLLLPLLPLLAGCGADRDPAREDAGPLAETGGTAVVCAQALPAALNPFVTPDQLAADLRLLLYTPLVLYAGDDGFRPWLAERWEWNADRTRLRFELRDDVRWHDGEPLSADDVVWTLDIARDTLYAYGGVADLAVITATRASGAHAVEIEFARPFTDDVEPFVMLPILPRHLLASLSHEEFARAPYHREPVGSGPFRFAGRTADGMLRFERAEDFPAGLGVARLDRIVFRPVPEPATLVVELQTGGVDLCVTGSSLARQFEEARNVRTLSVAPAGVQVIPLDTRRPPFDDVRVRRAVSAAIRRADLATIVSPLATPATSFLPASSRFLDLAHAQPDADSAQAVALLAAAGYANIGADGIRRGPDGQPLRFTLVATPALEPPLVVLQAQLRRVGIAVELRFMEGATYISTIRNPDTRPAAMALAFFPSKIMEPDPFAQLHSTGPSNLASYANPAVDSLILELRQLTDPDRRDDVYTALQRHVAEDVPTLYTLYLPRMAALGPRLEGVRVDLNGPFASVTEWWVPASRRR
jgi:peptide/nickel transport system substrate-binding protein